MWAFSPQNKPLSLGETVLLWPRNPAQKALLYKDEQKVLTPPEMTSRPPQGWSPPFQSRS